MLENIFFMLDSGRNFTGMTIWHYIECKICGNIVISALACVCSVLGIITNASLLYFHLPIIEICVAMSPSYFSCRIAASKLFKVSQINGRCQTIHLFISAVSSKTDFEISCSCTP